MVDDDVREALLVEVHRQIEAASNAAMEVMATGRALAYPPAGAEGQALLTAEERDALLALSVSPVVKNGVRKVVADAIASAMFHVFCVVDGVGDPGGWRGGTWLGLDLNAPTKDGDRPMLHDDFYDTYWTYVERRG